MDLETVNQIKSQANRRHLINQLNEQKTRREQEILNQYIEKVRTQTQHYEDLLPNPLLALICPEYIVTPSPQRTKELQETREKLIGSLDEQRQQYVDRLKWILRTYRLEPATNHPTPVEAYKVVRRHGDDLFSAYDSVRYDVLRWTFPFSGHGPLCCFTGLQEAIRFSVYDDFEIWKCLAVPSPEDSIWTPSQFPVPLRLLPGGTLLASRLMIYCLVKSFPQNV